MIECEDKVMKLRVPRVLLMAMLSTQWAVGAVMHSDVSRQTYVDFATNSGRYTVGTTNAMLDYIRQRDGGVSLSYTDTSAMQSYTLEHGMPDFDAVSDIGSSTAIGYNYVVTVAHQSAAPMPTFTANDWGIGTDRSIKYRGIEEESANSQFVHTLYGGKQDYKISRLSKLVTDVAPAAVYSGDITKNLTNALVYRVGGGTQAVWDTTGKQSEVNIAGMYTVGGIGQLSGVTDYATAGNDFVLIDIKSADKTTSGGATAATPLPFGTQGADSGSPYFVWDSESESFQFLTAHIGTYGATSKFAGAAPEWTEQVMESDNVRVNMGWTDGGIRFKGAEVDKGSGVTDSIQGTEVTVRAAVGFLSKQDGTNVYTPDWKTVKFNAVATGQHTWKSLSELKYKDAWYGYSDSYLNAAESVYYNEDKEAVIREDLTYAQLYQTQNVVFEAAKSGEVYNIYVDEDTDLGVGYVHFAANGHKDVVFHVQSDANKLLNSAGYVVDAGVQVNISLRNADDTYMREWRKVGEGTLNICGSGKNEIFLNIGGSGETQLNQSNGYAAYNVLVNTGSTVKIKDTEQIFRDLTFGNGGGTLDMNGNTMDWYTSGGENCTGFTINALTEEAVISNSAAQKAVLTFKETGKQNFVGSFRDGKDSALEIVYEAGAGNTWELTGIRTSLQHQESGLTVKSGTVRLTGTLTVHGYGSSSSAVDMVDFSTREDDWHYADATMNVIVEKGGTFELASHARLQGNVTVQTGGTYVMREGVNHAEEFIEGGETKESTGGDVAKYYGHKGDVLLASGAVMKVSYTEGTDTATHYDRKVSGPGSLVVDLGTDAAAWVMSGDITGLQSLAVQGKSRLDLQGSADALATTIAQNATLTLQSKTQDLVRLTADKSTATLHQIRMSSDSDTEATMKGTGENARVESARVEVQSGATLVLDKVALADDVHLVLAENAAVRMEQAAFALTATNTAGAEVGLNSAITLRGCGTPDILTLDADAKVYSMVSNALVGAITLEGSSLLLDMRALGDLSGYDAIQFRFGDMVAAAAAGETGSPAFADLDSMVVQALMADGSTWHGFYNAQDSSGVYLAYVPEPATATLSLLGLAALCARRRRRLA